MAYSSTMVANNILLRSFRERRYITPMKLQKILYFVASEYAKRTGSPLLDEPFQTWKFGPVAYSVYNEFRPFARRNIKKFARDALGHALAINEGDDHVLGTCLDIVWEATKGLSAVKLSEITHERDSAWFKAFQDYRPALDDEEIQEDYTYRSVLGIS